MRVCVTRTEVVRNQCHRTTQTKYVQKYVYHKFQPDPLMVGFIAVLEQTPQLQQFLCANSTKIPNIDATATSLQGVYSLIGQILQTYYSILEYNSYIHRNLVQAKKS